MENKSIAIVLHNIPGKQTFTDVCECTNVDAMHYAAFLNIE